MTEDLKSEHVFTLTTPFKYARGGEQVEAGFITLTAPTSKNSRECAALTQAFHRASANARRENVEVDDETRAAVEDMELTGDMVMAGIGQSTDVDLGEVLDIARKLFTAGGVALVDGETQLNSHMADCISFKDLQSMTGEYIVGFTIA